MARKSGVVIRTTKYEKFRGVDFSTDPALVDASRSPWAPNMVSDTGGLPEKRPGWRVLEKFEEHIGPTTVRYIVKNVFATRFDGKRQVLALIQGGGHLNTGLFLIGEDGSASVPLWGRSGGTKPGQAVMLHGYLWIFTGKELLRYDGSEYAETPRVREAKDVAYVPTTIISRDPSGGGTAYEAVNKLTGKQRVGFLADGTSTVYKLPYEDVGETVTVEINGETVETGFTVDALAGTVTFATAPAAPAAGQGDNVFITFDSLRDTAADIEKCTIAFTWGVDGGGDRIVASGRHDAPNVDYISAYNDATYWPDLNYAVIGGDDTPIVGYRRLGAQLAILKGEGGNGGSVYIRSASLDSGGAATFTVKPCIAGIGAVSPYGFGHIGDEQLVLTRQGVYALVTNNLTAERIAQDRSHLIESRLTREDLSAARCCEWNNCLLVFAGGHVYGLDGRRPFAYSGRGDTSYLYECFYWENVPASCAACDETDGSVFFGTEDGRVCRFNTDMDSDDRFSDGGSWDYSGETPVFVPGEAIEAVWATKLDDDGDPTVLKTMLKRGCAVSVKPFVHATAKVQLRTERDAAARDAAEGETCNFDWEHIDFAHFSFEANDAPWEVQIRRKVKNYKRLQILVKNDRVGEGFGVYAIVKHFVTGNFAKR